MESMEDAINAIVVEAIDSWGPLSNAPLFTARIIAAINIHRAATTKASPSLLRAWASEPMIRQATFEVFKAGEVTPWSISVGGELALNGLADALERAEEEKP